MAVRVEIVWWNGTSVNLTDNRPDLGWGNCSVFGSSRSMIWDMVKRVSELEESPLRCDCGGVEVEASAYGNTLVRIAGCLLSIATRLANLIRNGVL